jgi:hypothetical protein
MNHNDGAPRNILKLKSMMKRDIRNDVYIMYCQRKQGWTHIELRVFTCPL